MISVKDKLINSLEAFLRETFEKRMAQYGFKSIERMEKFLWNLELFLHIQAILGDKIVLKGGAAIQFYLPVEAQRTSVDIDMMFYGTKNEIDETLIKISENFGINDRMFIFREHKPKEPKTTLPLFTYYVNVPSVLTAKERRSIEEDDPSQEVKVEFIMQDELVECVRTKGLDIFAVRSDIEYQILPLNYLFADKLTTLGPNTIGVQNYRLDEQVKQFYDIWMLTQFHFKELQIEVIREKYIKRAKQECEDRKYKLDIDEIKSDVRRQLLRFADVDGGDYGVLKKIINDFNGLYLNSKVDFSPQVVACGAALVLLMYETIIDGEKWNVVETAFETENMLKLEAFTGKEKGQKAKLLREMLVREFGSYSAMKFEVLKGKRHPRIFWSVVSKDNVYEIKRAVEEVLGFNQR